MNTRVILPIYNEGSSLAKTLDTLIKFSLLHTEFAFTLVDDGSTDNTAELLASKLIDNPRINYLSHKFNRGKAKIIKEVVLACKEDSIIYTDGDLAYSLEHLLEVNKHLQKYPIVIGNRNLAEHKHPNFKRKITGETFNRLVRSLLRLKITDTQAGLKGFHRNVAQELFTLQRVTDFSFDAELLYIAKLKNHNIYQIPAQVGEHHYQKASTLKLMSDSPKMLKSLFVILYNSKSGRYNG